jgi:hypothetical protein
MKKQSKMDNVKIGEIDIPIKYFDLSEYEKSLFCNTMVDSLLITMDRVYPPEFNRITLLNDILDSSIQTNEKDELYEVAQVLTDIKKLLNDC